MALLVSPLLEIGRLTRVVRFRDALSLVLAPRARSWLTVNLRGVGSFCLRGNGTDARVLRQIFVERHYDHDWVRQSSPRVIVDAGANIGASTVFFAATFPRARVIAVEPDPDNADLLVRNTARYPGVEVVRGALWPRTERLDIRDRSAEPWAFTMVPRGDGPVAAVTVPDLLDRYGDIDILKLDIEGAEREVFGAEAASWLGRVRLLCVELHDRLSPGASRAFYSAVVGYPFSKEQRGEIDFVRLEGPADAP